MKPNENKGFSRESFGSFVEEHSANLTRYAWHLTGNLETAREIVQDAFLKLAKADIEKIRDHLVPWVYAVCRNLAIDRKRKEGKLIMNSKILIEQTNASKDPDPASASISSETRSMLKKCIEDLPEREREVIVLKFQNGLKYRDIARITQLSESNVGFILHQTIGKLRKSMLRSS
ncbi:MAG: sigma-70 family RNA polymerase sigma factor [Opitutales bacterium]|nr:sigma-70 family RNA polymerase sigma factor [Opitutales bacterium]